MTIGDKIKHLRKSANMTQTELGNILGVKKNAVSKWECGRVDDIPASKIKAMANLFNVPTSYLVDEESNIQSHQYNIVKIAARDGSYQEKRLSDEDLAVITRIIDTLPDASDDL